MSWKANILTIYPDMYPGPLSHSLIGKALEKKIWELNVYDLKEFGIGKHKKVDDKPFGGGPGMILRPDVLTAAIDQTLIKNHEGENLIYLSPKGQPITQKIVSSYSMLSGVSLICGHFEGIDQRILDTYNIKELSLGDYVLSGGEIASFPFLDSIIRLLPGVLGNDSSIKEESFSSGFLEYPHYTRPQKFNDIEVPEVLLSGNHSEIMNWRLKEAKMVTRKRRPDLLKNKEEKK
ncbi:MAG: tRNA (guanosine(37)-N1)-methyltransferase TrmD [Pseudomonadota bacterium]|nr:tRNA (guanosine(37)-N1)-methyltransferase TrmD [Pseudomonadota bacterium]MEC9459261.1 tRNA (guanosine(37)-N1)-methyltransferase TrmD [Pseudomonadota bacterium]